jgi:uncharacterized membrane protein
MNETDIAVAIYDSHTEAEAAVKTLERAGFDMKKISIVGRDYHTEEQPLGYFNTGERAMFFGKLGAFWGGLAGLLFGSALVFAPLFGHIVVLGPLAATLVGGLQGAALGGGTGALVGALSALGIPKYSVLRFASAVKADKFLLLLHADAREIARAHQVLRSAGLESFERHGEAVAH